MNFAEAETKKATDEKRYKVLYIDDDLSNVRFMKILFEKGEIDAFLRDNPGKFIPEQIALLKKVDLVGVLNDPNQAALDKDQKNPGKADTARYEEFEHNLTPMSKELRKIYNGEYAAIITDMQMPRHNDDGAGGVQIIDAAKIARVPVVAHSFSSSDQIRDAIATQSAFRRIPADEPTADSRQQKERPYQKSERHQAFSQSVPSAEKLDQADIYVKLVPILEKLSKEQGAARG